MRIDFPYPGIPPLEIAENIEVDTYTLPAPGPKTDQSAAVRTAIDNPIDSGTRHPNLDCRRNQISKCSIGLAADAYPHLFSLIADIDMIGFKL